MSPSTVVTEPGSVARWMFVGMLSITGCVIVDDQKEAGASDEDATDADSTWGSDEPDSGEPEADEPEQSIAVSVDWGDAGLSLEVGEGGVWQLGMAETGGSCGETVPCWTGEDCFVGFEADGSSYGPWCHAVEGGELTLAYGGQMAAFEAGTTVFRPDFADTVTFVLLPDGAERSGGLCYVFGDRPAYYSDLGCVVLPF